MIYGSSFLICIKTLRLSATWQLKNTDYLIYIRNWTRFYCNKQTNKYAVIIIESFKHATVRPPVN
ncbi:MAG: hypothetical protein RLZZ215_1929 [Pseudomonadota bacterium]|jgi:hypothetical protein